MIEWIVVAALSASASSAFDPVRDETAVIDCFAAYMTQMHVAHDSLNMSDAEIKAKGYATPTGARRLEPFVGQVRARIGDKPFFSRAVDAGLVWEDQAAAEKTLERRQAVMDRLLDKARQCDRLVESWGVPPSAS